MLGEGGAKSCRREKLDRYGELTEEGGGFAVARGDQVLERLELPCGGAMWGQPAAQPKKTPPHK